MNKLNRYITIIAFSLLLPLFFSCNKALEEEPQNKLKPSSVTDYDELLNFGYPNAKAYDDDHPLDYYVEMLADDADIRGYNATTTPYPMIPFSFQPTHEDRTMLGGSDQAWKWFYQAIYYANVVIEGVDNSEGELKKKNYVKGEAMLLRAFSYFKLVNIYAKPYNEATAATDAGVPLKLDPVVKAESYTRNSVKEIYDQIDKDITDGIKLMEDNDIKVTNKFKISIPAANLLASRVALYKKNYPNTIAYASKVIKTNPAVFDLSIYKYDEVRSWGYGFADRLNYFTSTKSNILFLFGTNEFYYYFYAPQVMALSDDLINTYEPGDIRLYYFSYPVSYGRVYYKYRPFPNRVGEANHAFRVEEAYLNRAEAYAETDKGELALDDINYLRRYKFDPSYGADPEYYKYKSTQFATKEALVDTVRQERRRELCFEFHRWYDLRRYGMPRIEHNFQTQQFILEENDLRYTLQIPQRELDYNPLMEPNPR